MAGTDILAYTNIQGRKTRHIRGVVGTTVALVARIFEPRCLVTVINNDATAANTVFIGIDDEAVSTTTGFHVHGGAVSDGDTRSFYLSQGQTLNAVATADRNVSFVIQVLD